MNMKSLIEKNIAFGADIIKLTASLEKGGHSTLATKLLYAGTELCEQIAEIESKNILYSLQISERRGLKLRYWLQVLKFKNYENSDIKTVDKILTDLNTLLSDVEKFIKETQQDGVW